MGEAHHVNIGGKDRTITDYRRSVRPGSKCMCMVISIAFLSSFFLCTRDDFSFCYLDETVTNYMASFACVYLSRSIIVNVCMIFV